MAAEAAGRGVLVIGAQGVLGTALVPAFEEAGSPRSCSPCPS
jgi:hypothetical protein